MAGKCWKAGRARLACAHARSLSLLPAQAAMAPQRPRAAVPRRARARAGSARGLCGQASGFVFKDVIKVNAFKDPKARPRPPPPRGHGRAAAAARQPPPPPRVTLFCQLTFVN